MPRRFQLGQQPPPVFGRSLAAGPGLQPRARRVPIDGDPEGDVDGAVGDLPVTDATHTVVVRTVCVTAASITVPVVAGGGAVAVVVVVSLSAVFVLGSLRLSPEPAPSAAGPSGEASGQGMNDVVIPAPSGGVAVSVACHRGSPGFRGSAASHRAVELGCGEAALVFPVPAREAAVSDGDTACKERGGHRVAASEKTLSQEIRELLQLERVITAHKPPGQPPPRDQWVVYLERRRDVFRRIAKQAKLCRDRDEEQQAAASAQQAQHLLDDLGKAEETARERLAPGAPAASVGGRRTVLAAFTCRALCADWRAGPAAAAGRRCRRSWWRQRAS